MATRIKKEIAKRNSKKIKEAEDSILGLIDVDLTDRIKSDFLTYTLSTITRGIPFSSDGLKPVQRRLLIVLLSYENRLTKSARIVGDTLGMYHPHGDLAVYDAMVSLAQPFKRLYPLIKGQGNWGTIDGDAAASMRYTECRISDFCRDVYFAEGWKFIDWHKNYDDTLDEPTTLAPAIPALLVNGSKGIVTGFANNIPPHNLREVCDATLAYLEGDKNCISKIKGPDLPTGGIIEDTPLYIQKSMESGRGVLTVKGKYEIIPWDRGRIALQVTELPYGRTKEAIIDQFKKEFKDGKVYKEEKSETIESDTEDSTNNEKVKSTASRIQYTFLSKHISSDGVVDLSDSKICLNFVFKKGVTFARAKEVAEYLEDSGILTNTIMYTGNIVEVDSDVMIPKRAGFYDLIDDWYKNRSKVLKAYFTAMIDKLEHTLKLHKDVLVFIENFEKLAHAVVYSKPEIAEKLFSKYGINSEGYNYIISKSFKSFQNKGGQIVGEIKSVESDLKQFKKNLGNIKRYISSEVINISEKYGESRRTKIVNPTKKSKTIPPRLLNKLPIVISNKKKKRA